MILVFGQNILLQYNIRGITIDNNNIPWLSTDENKLLKFENSIWTTYQITNYNFTGNIAIDINNDKWVCADSGLVEFDGINWTTYNTPLSNELFSIAIDTNNNVWIGTHDAGLLKFDGTYWTVYDINNSNLISNYIKDIKIDKEGKLWLLINQFTNSIGYFDGANFVQYTSSNSCLPSSDIRAITFDNNNAIWIAYFDGLIKYDGQEWEKWFVSSQNNNHQIYNNSCNLISQDNTSGLVFQSCNYIYVDNDNNKWISNRDIVSEPPGKVIKFDDNNWEVFSLDNSTIPDNTAYYINQNENSNLWFVTLQNSTCYSGCDFSISEYDCSGQYTSIHTVSQDSFKIYPNPDKDNLTVVARSGATKQSVSIYTLQGQLLMQKTMEQERTMLDISNFAKGLYLIKVTNNNGTEVVKFAKE